MSDQAESNYAWFRQQLPDLMSQHRGYHALLHNQRVEAFFTSSLAAIRAGFARYGEGNFSVEAIEDQPEDLGFYSHVGSALRA